MATIANIIIGIALVATALILLAGLVSMGFENKFFNEEVSNRLMRWRVGVQGAAVALMGLAIVAAAPIGGIPALALAIAGACAMGGHMLWQLRRLRLDDNDRLLALFRSNRNAGLLPVLFFATALFA